MDFLVDAFAPTFMQRALVAGSLAAVISAMVGTWVVIRGLSFMGDALAHGVLPGIALGLVLGFDPTLGAVASAGAMVLGIEMVHRHSRLGEDTGIGLLFVGMLALGVVIISASDSGAVRLTGILFGDTLGVTDGDIAILAIATAATIVASIVMYRAFMALSFNAQKADMLGLRPRLAHLMMISLVTMAVVVSFRTVGTLLVFALLVAPPATAALVARRVPVMMLLSSAIGVVVVGVGLLISFHAGTAGSATVAALAVAIFFAVLPFTARRVT